MRTKLILGAAIIAAGVVSATAQNVYSLNVVGYYNKTAPAGGTVCLANQLNAGGNAIGEVLTAAGYGDQVLTFVNNDYVTDVFDGTAWLDANSGNPSTTTLPPGKGFFYQNLQATDETVTFVGEVPQGALSLPIPPGTALVGTMTPQALELTAANTFPQMYGMQQLAFVNNDYVVSVNDGTGWLDANSGNPVVLAPAVGEGYFLQNIDATAYAWDRNFTVQ